MPLNIPSSLFPYLVIFSFSLFYIYFSLLPFNASFSSSLQPSTKILASSSCNLFNGQWVFDPKNPKPLYDETCPFHRNSWNCIKNQRDNMDRINSWTWAPKDCHLPRIDPARFLGLMRNKNIGLVGDSLSENFLVSFLCILRVADMGAKKWKKKGAWRGAYFPLFNVTVAYHRAVLLAKYKWQATQSAHSDHDGLKGVYRVDVDIPADDWASTSHFYDVFIFNTGHWWGYDKFPKETPLVFHRGGKPIIPPLAMLEGLKVVLDNMVSYIKREIPEETLKFWRLQSPRHFYGGEWNQNGSCLFNEPLEELKLDLWFDPSNDGVNKEARQVNLLIKDAVSGTDIRVFDVTRLSEFRADAHPAIWLGKKDAVAVWGQDCLHWCLPGVPDTWVDILTELIRNTLPTT